MNETIIRIGQGFDVHPFAENRKLVLGGIEIANHPGLAGHSDADVLLHAVMDALLGALALGDIGTWFPDTDIAYHNANSVHLLEKILKDSRLQGWAINNLDCTILAESPKISPFRELIQQKIATILKVQPNQISIKATTMEKMGFIGRKEGIAVQAIILIQNKNQV